tara:strand:+ start:878 stop:1525 length:648 start_codon:yes stop_codon:yes gene_type:complete
MGTSSQDNIINIMNTIDTIEKQENILFGELDKYDNVSNVERSNSIRLQLDSLNTLKTNLYQSLNQIYTAQENNVNINKIYLEQQEEATQAIKNEVKNVKSLNNNLHQQIDNKKRMVEINNYYGDRYSHQIELMKLIIYISVPILLISFLTKKGLLPFNISLLLSGIILILGFVFIIRKINDLANRNNMNYSEYDFPFNENDHSNASVSLQNIAST